MNFTDQVKNLDLMKNQSHEMKNLSNILPKSLSKQTQKLGHPQMLIHHYPSNFNTNKNDRDTLFSNVMGKSSS